MKTNPAGRNIRTVWTIPTQPFSGAHFATFPEALVEPCIKAGTSEKGCCSKCGNPWERILERKAMVIQRSPRTHEMGQTRSSGTMVAPAESQTLGWQPSCLCYERYCTNCATVVDSKSTGGLPQDAETTAAAYQKPLPALPERHLPLGSCQDCGGPLVSRPPAISSAVVLDIFCGTGTVGRVARKLGRSFIGLDLSRPYLKMAQKRIGAPLAEDGERQQGLEEAGQTKMEFQPL